MSETSAMSEHERIDALLPWFVNDTLQKNERDDVTRHLSGCEECRQNVALLSRVDAELRKQTTVPIVPDAKVSEFMDALDRTGATSARSPYRWAIAASFVVLALVSTAFLAGRFGAPGPVAIYETATSENPAAPMNYVLTLRFAEGTTQQDRLSVFEKIGAREFAVSERDKTYEVLVQLDAATLQDVQGYTERVMALPEVRSVEVTAVQLPIRNDL